MKILITGANGQLGRELTKQYNEKGNVELILTDVDTLDITNVNDVYKMVNETRPDVIINCAAHTAVDKCEDDVDNAYKINAVGPKNLAAAMNAIGGEIVQVSTDYVFDGTSEKPYLEFDKPCPASVYGQTKYDGEEFVKALNPKHYIVRTAWLYGDGNNFVKTMIRLGENNPEVKVVNYQFGSPTSTTDSARGIISLVENKNYGIFHGTCKGQCSWYYFAKEFFALKGMDLNLVPCTSEEFKSRAKRPKYSVLRNYMLELTTGDVTREWKESLKEYLENLK